MDFGEALAALRGGKRVARGGWNGKGMWIALEKPHPNAPMTMPYIYMRTAENNFVPWTASQTDLFAEDWEIIVE